MFTGLQLPTNKLRVSGIRLGLPTSITTKIKQVLHRVPWHPLVTKSQWRRFSGGKSRWRLQGRSEKYLHMVPVPWPFHVWGTQTSHQQPTKQGAEWKLGDLGLRSKKIHQIHHNQIYHIWIYLTHYCLFAEAPINHHWHPLAPSGTQWHPVDHRNAAAAALPSSPRTGLQLAAPSCPGRGSRFDLELSDFPRRDADSDAMNTLNTNWIHVF